MNGKQSKRLRMLARAASPDGAAQTSPAVLQKDRKSGVEKLVRPPSVRAVHQRLKKAYKACDANLTIKQVDETIRQQGHVTVADALSANVAYLKSGKHAEKGLVVMDRGDQ